MCLSLQILTLNDIEKMVALVRGRVIKKSL